MNRSVRSTVRLAMGIMLLLAGSAFAGQESVLGETNVTSMWEEIRTAPDAVFVYFMAPGDEIFYDSELTGPLPNRRDVFIFVLTGPGVWTMTMQPDAAHAMIGIGNIAGQFVFDAPPGLGNPVMLTSFVPAGLQFGFVIGGFRPVGPFPASYGFHVTFF